MIERGLPIRFRLLYSPISDVARFGLNILRVWADGAVVVT